jgi:hypothetical protein
MACIVNSGRNHLPLVTPSATPHFFRASDEEALENWEQPLEREEIPRAKPSLAPEYDSTVRPCPARNSPGPWPCPGSRTHGFLDRSAIFHMRPRLLSGLRVRDSIFTRISNCRRHSLAGWTRATEIIHHAQTAPSLPFPSIFFARVI